MAGGRSLHGPKWEYYVHLQGVVCISTLKMRTDTQFSWRLVTGRERSVGAVLCIKGLPSVGARKLSFASTTNGSAAMAIGKDRMGVIRWVNAVSYWCQARRMQAAFYILPFIHSPISCIADQTVCSKKNLTALSFTKLAFYIKTHIFFIAIKGIPYFHLRWQGLLVPSLKFMILAFSF